MTQNQTFTTPPPFNNVQQWWYEFNGTSHGPYNNQEILDFINQGAIVKETLVWNSGLVNWTAAKDTIWSSHFITATPPPINGLAINNNLVWWLAFCPLLGKVLERILVGMFYPEPALDYNSTESLHRYTDYLTKTDFSAFWFVTLALNFFLSYKDEQVLKRAGLNTKQLGSVFLVPFYLFKRAEMLKQNNVYFWVWLILFILTLL